MFLETEELKEQIIIRLNKIQNYTDKQYCIDIRIYFEKAEDYYADSGEYVYSDADGYHIEYVGDYNGRIGDKFTTINTEELYHKLFCDVSDLISIRYASKNKIKGKDWRRIMFNYQLELLSLLGEEYYKKGKEKIDKILEEAPYDDSLF